MLKNQDADPSPFRAGLLHGFLSLAVFGGVAGLMGGLVHMTGDPAQAGPQHVVALFQTDGEAVPELRTRASNAARNSAQVLTLAGANAAPQASEPSLGVPDPTGNRSGATARQITPPQAQQIASVPNKPRGVRINGKLVSPGQSFSGLDQTTSGGASAKGVPVVSDARIAQILAEPATATPASSTYARPFANPDGKPIVSLVIGGIGTSYRQSLVAIDELPPEITLSFVPNANPELLRYARKKGHEILLEVPMEDYGRSRARPHRDTLLANASGEQNILRLDSVLRGKKALYGVISDKGGKFATTENASAPVLGHLQDKGLAFFQHGSLERANFETAANALNMDFAAAQINIDTEIRASEIEASLFKLETQALEDGAAFGTGFSYPLTIDTVARWSQRLRAKGILLAPASAVVAQAKQARSFQTSQLIASVSTPDASP